MNDLSTLMRSRVESEHPDLATLASGSIRRGRRIRRVRYAGASLATAAVVAGVAVGAAALPGGRPGVTELRPAAGQSLDVSQPGPTMSAVPLDLSPVAGAKLVVPPTAGSKGLTSDDSKPSATGPAQPRTKVPTYTAAPDAPLTLHDAAIHAKLATLLPAGRVGPILTQNPYPQQDDKNNRILHFTYDGAVVSFIIAPARGNETCESLAANADPHAGFGKCQTVGDAQVLTETQDGPMALHSAMVWRHGYEISILSYNTGPSDAPNPGLDGKKLKTVTKAPPLDVSSLVAAASSDAWFE